MAIIFHESNNTFNDTLPGISLSHQTGTQSGSHLAPHWHERMEIWHIHSGHMTVSCEQDIFDVFAGDILIVNPGQVHSCRVVEVPAAIDCMIFDVSSLLTNRPGEIDQLLRSISGGKLRFQHIIRKNPSLQSILDEIVSCPKNSPWSSLRVEGLLFCFLSFLSERYVSTENYAVPRHLREVSGLLEYIHTHFSQELTLENLAAEACMSPSYFCRWFKSAVGESPMAYVTTLRINKAYELLASGGYSVTDACRKVGMADLNSFNRQFQKRVGIAPSKIKKLSWSG